MSITFVDILCFLLLLVLMTGPWWWMNWLTDEQNMKYGNIAFKCLPYFAMFMTFGRHKDFWNPNKVMFSNDGSFGFMQSAHSLEAFPGGSGWNDLYWLGQPEGDYPIDISYCLIWASNHRNISLPILFIVLLTYQMVCRGKKS